MYHTTGLTKRALNELCEALWERYPMTLCAVGRPPALTFRECVTITLTYIRRNRTQDELAEQFGVSQPTVSRTVSTWTSRILTTLVLGTPTVDDLDPRDSLIVDGTLLPCWSWRTHPELYSGKHHTTGYNVQVACTHTGRLAWVSDPVPGSRHDSYALRTSGFLEHFRDTTHVGDKGYIGLGMITPFRKQPGQPRTDEEKEYNKSVNTIRYIIEQAIAHLKTWRIIHTDYRRPVATFAETISTVIALEFYKMTF